MQHGIFSTYNNKKCRCDLCKAANARYQKDYRARNAKLNVPMQVHGTVNGYENFLCRCPACKRAHNLAAQRRKTSQEVL